MLQKELIRVNKNNKDQIEIRLSFFDNWKITSIILNSEDYRLIKETGEDFLRELLIKYICCEIQETYGNWIKSNFAQKITIDDFAYINSSEINFRIYTKEGVLIECCIKRQDKDWVKDLKIPDYFIDRQIQVVKEELIKQMLRSNKRHLYMT